MGAKAERLRGEITEILDKIRELNSRDNPTAEDYKSIKDYIGKVNERKEQLETVKESEALDAEFTMSADAKGERGQEAMADPKVSLGQYF